MALKKSSKQSKKTCVDWGLPPYSEVVYKENVDEFVFGVLLPSSNNNATKAPKTDLK